MEQLDILKLRAFVLQLNGDYNACQQYIKKSDINQGRKLLKLWIHIDNCKGKYTDNQEDRMEAHSILFGKNTAYSAKKMQTLTSQLRGIVVKYIRSQVMEESSLGLLLLAEAYRKSGLRKLADQALESAIEKANLEKGTMAKFVRSIAYRYQYDIGKRSANIPKGKLEMSDEELDDFYFERKLQTYIDQISKRRCLRRPIEERFLKKLNNFLIQLPQNPSPLIDIRRKVLSFYMTPSSEAYLLLKEAYFSTSPLLLKSEIGVLLIDLVSSLTVIRNLDPELRKEYVFLYKYGLKNDLLTQNGKISGLRYDNIIFSAEFIGDYEFIKEVVERLGPLIDGKKEQKRSLLLSRAYRLFGEGNFREAIAELRVLEKAKDVPYYFFLRKHLLVLKCLYEQGESSIDALVNIKNERDAFYRMLNRYVGEHIYESVKISYINFYLLLRGLADCNTSQESLQGQLESFGSEIVELKWLIEKLADRKK